MSHFAFIPLSFFSHVRALEALASALLDRGHRVTWIHQVDVLATLQDARIAQRAIGLDTHPPGSLADVVARAARPGSPFGLQRVIRDMGATTAMLCREGPQALRAIAPDAIVGDQMEAAAGLVAEHLGLPWASVACALPLNREARIPLPVMPWLDGHSDPDLQRIAGSARVYDWVMSEHGRVVRQCAQSLGVRPRASIEDCLSPRLQLSQTTASFDFPRRELPACFHHVGPLRRAAASARREPLGLDARSGRPLVFASLGTLQGGRFRLFRRIAIACRALDVQLLVAHCGGLDAAQCRALERAGATWVTDFVAQEAVLARADVVVTHAGLNTVLESLRAGRPMLALPIAFDQPGVAARVVRAGAGIRLWPMLATAGKIRGALRRLLDDADFARRAAALGVDVEASGGAARAAELVEKTLGVAQTGEVARAA